MPDDDETPTRPHHFSLAELRSQWEALATEPLTGLPREALVASIHDLAGELLARTPARGQLYLIWSNEHRGFWRPHEHGYTPVMEWAGLYSEAETRAIMEKSALGEPVDAHDPLGVFADAHVAREVPIPVTVHPGGSACPPPGYYARPDHRGRGQG